MKWLKRILATLGILALLGIGALAGLYLWIAPTLPGVDSLKTVQLQTPMRVYSADGQLMSQFGEKRRIPLRYDEIPDPLIQAVLATEDARFFEHRGVDPIGVMRAAVVLVTTGRKSQGASTITMQVARNFFLTREKTYIRKVKEIFLALEIERLLTKEEILELYLNRSFLGNRAYGVGAAAQVYYGRDVQELTLAEMAMIAGLPQAPSAANPIRNPDRARNRRNVVLSRMMDVGYISRAEFDEARQAPITARYHGAEIDLYAPYIAEMVRDHMVATYGEEEAYTSGFRIYTTITAETQHAAQRALLDNLFAYDTRHGYRGPVTRLWGEPLEDQNQAIEAAAWDPERIQQHLRGVSRFRDLHPAVVLAVEEKSAEVMNARGERLTLPWEGINWARAFLTDSRQGNAPKQAAEVMTPGDQIWIRQHDGHWWLSQVPEVSSAFVALDPNDGAIQALVGGYDFGQSQYNRVTQAKRQLGSNIKPFLYSSALEEGFTLATLVNNAPINQWDRSQGTAWRPRNSPDVYTGPTRVRQGLAQSINVMAVRVLREIGVDEFIDHATLFGFDRADIPRNESVSLGSASATPMENARAFAVFANGGFLVDPYFIERIEDYDGNVIFESQPKIACLECKAALAQTDSGTESQEARADFAQQCPWPADRLAPQVISEQNAFLIHETLKSVIWGGGDWSQGTGWNGTAWRAARLIKRRDIGGKTGTTNEARDTWFTGFAPNLVATAWVGFDDHGRQLGRTRWNPYGPQDQITAGESGAKTAGPAWNQFMHQVLNGVPQESSAIPEGIVTARIDLASGKLSNRNDASSRFEYFIDGTAPTELAEVAEPEAPVFEQEATEELF
ncbi:penicillin-binding protein 1A [Ferrimonas balearica]|uniref:penicillin-binding protein 1A n=1 Tax=Ferrimonas balearica TaxID=44012 RepID=UPI001C995E2F|nr:PBP1A family penicillin-binding protein [Ferrimonas balearica]MBY5992089.1 PBP1A family penicillin-binding protein [Ferrimonas balearica]